MSGEDDGELKCGACLHHLLEVFHSHADGKPRGVPTWEHWLGAGGELPPDFLRLSTSATLPDVLASIPESVPPPNHQAISQIPQERLAGFRHGCLRVRDASGGLVDSIPGARTEEGGRRV